MSMFENDGCSTVVTIFVTVTSVTYITLVTREGTLKEVILYNTDIFLYIPWRPKALFILKSSKMS